MSRGEPAGAGHLLRSLGVRGSCRRGLWVRWGAAARVASAGSALATSGGEPCSVSIGEVVTGVRAFVKTHQTASLWSVRLFSINKQTYKQKLASGKKSPVGGERDPWIRERVVFQVLGSEKSKFLKVARREK